MHHKKGADFRVIAAVQLLILFLFTGGLFLSSRLGDETKYDEAVLGQSINSNNEILIPTVGNEKQYIVTLKEPAIGGDGQKTPDNTELVDLVQRQVINRNSSSLNSNRVTTFENIPSITATLSVNEAESLKKDPQVAAVQENKVRFISLDDSVPLINADDTHADGYDGTGVAVAVLDTGVDNTHPFVNVISEACYSNTSGFGGGESLCPNDNPSQVGAGSGDNCTGVSGCDHGTHVGGIIGGDGDPGVGYTGVAKGAGIIAIQVFTKYDDSICVLQFGYTPCLGASDSDIISGLDRVLSLHNDSGFTTPIAAANLSLGGGGFSNQASCDSAGASYKTVIDNLRTAGIATVVASGNDGDSANISSPGCISSAVAVGSTTKSNAISSFSNSNSLLDLLAPGSGILSSVPGDNFSTFSGTSMATPHIAGSWALFKQLAPELSVDEVLTAIDENGPSVLDSRNNLSFTRVDTEASFSVLSQLINTEITDKYSIEDGDEAVVRFSLRSQPTDPVTIPLSLSDTSEASLSSVTEIVITPANWNQPENNEVTITGIDDADPDGDIEYQLLTGDPTSLDSTFGDLTSTDVEDPELVNSDDEWLKAEVVFGDTDGNGKDEAHYVKYEDTGSGQIEIHTWNDSYTGWKTNSTTNHAERPAKDIRVVFGDTDGNGKDEAHLIKFNNTGTGTMEIHTWKPGYKAWASNNSTNHAVRSLHQARVVFGDTDANGKDEAHFIKNMDTGSGKIEIHKWNPGYKSWASNRATNHDWRPASQAQVYFGNTTGNLADDAHFIKYTNTGSGKIEVHTWNQNYNGWVSNNATNHDSRPPSQTHVSFDSYSPNKFSKATYSKYISTGSGQVEVHHWNNNFSTWSGNRATNHVQLGTYTP